eukprot:COSAG01_NODE_29499_length_636_cov_0.945996_2_plen_160_part_01
MHNKLLRHNASLPADQQEKDPPSYSSREWNELIAEGRMFPKTVPPAGTPAAGYGPAKYVPMCPTCWVVSHLGECERPKKMTRHEETRDRTAATHNVVRCSSFEEGEAFCTHDLGSHQPKIIAPLQRNSHACKHCYETKEYEEGPRKGKPVRSNPQFYCPF